MVPLMGLYDRDYYRNSLPRGGFGHFSALSVTTWLIVINVAAFGYLLMRNQHWLNPFAPRASKTTTSVTTRRRPTRMFQKDGSKDFNRSRTGYGADRDPCQTITRLLALSGSYRISSNAGNHAPSPHVAFSAISNPIGAV
jgi:hypothetical protein